MDRPAALMMKDYGASRGRSMTFQVIDGVRRVAIAPPCWEMPAHHEEQR
jgi:hypothetical protein